jgi:hypothetical protein
MQTAGVLSIPFLHIFVYNVCSFPSTAHMLNPSPLLDKVASEKLHQQGLSNIAKLGFTPLSESKTGRNTIKH